MEKLQAKKVYVVNSDNVDERHIFPVDIEGLTEKEYLIENGHFSGCYLAKTEDGVVLCDDPFTLTYKGWKGVGIPELETLDDVQGLHVKGFDIFIAKSLVADFIDAYTTIKGNDIRVLKNIDMVTFAQYYQILPEKVFGIKDLTTSVKTEAYSILEHAVDKKTKGLAPEVKDDYKRKARVNLGALIDFNLGKGDGEPANQ